MGVYVASPTLAVLNLVRVTVIPETKDSSVAPRKRVLAKDNLLCWFTIPEMVPEKKTNLPRSSAYMRATAYDHLVLAGDSGKEVAATPDGAEMGFADAKYCGIAGLVGTHAYVTHNGTILASCTQGSVRVIRNGGSTDIQLKDRSSIPFVITDSWTAPVALISTGNVKIRPSGGFAVYEGLMVINYQTGKVRALQGTTELDNSEIFTGSGEEYALSASGERLAIVGRSGVRVVELSVP
jgi:hypothetical protein